VQFADFLPEAKRAVAPELRRALILVSHLHQLIPRTIASLDSQLTREESAVFIGRDALSLSVEDPGLAERVLAG
jgi:hypothetical protein